MTRMSETELLKIIRRVTGISQEAGKQEATQPDSVIAKNYARVVAEVMRRDGIELNGVDIRNIRTRVSGVVVISSPRGDVPGERKNYLPLEEAGAVAAVTG